MKLFFIIGASLIVIGIAAFYNYGLLANLFSHSANLDKSLATANTSFLQNINSAETTPASENKGNPQTNSRRALVATSSAPKKENALPVPLASGSAEPSSEPFPSPEKEIIILPTASPQQSAAASPSPNSGPNPSLTVPAANEEPILCATGSPKILSHSVVINEVAWAGVASDKTSQEWIELKNTSGSKISLAGWQLQNSNQNIKVFFGTSDYVPAGGFYLLERGSADFLPGIKTDKFFSNAIKNSDEALRIFDKDCNVIDEVAANVGADKNWPAGSASPDYRSAERSSDLSWHTYSGSGANGVFGTPRAENSPAVIVINSVQAQPTPSPSPSPSPSPLPSPSLSPSPSPSPSPIPSPSPAPSPNPSSSPSPPPSPLPSPSPSTAPSGGLSNVNHILISQIQITGGSGQTANDFIEIYNPMGQPFDLKGYRLVKRSQSGTTDTSIKSWAGDTFIPTYGFYLWANSGFTAIAVAPDATTTASIADNDAVAIRFGAADTGTIIDSVAWGEAQNAFIESAVFPTNPAANQSILRKSWQGACSAASFDAAIGNGCDTDNNASDFELTSSSQPRNSQTQ